MPDRLPSLIVLVGFWVPPAMAGWAAAGSLQRSMRRNRAKLTSAVLAGFVLADAVAWFLFNLGRMSPYSPGAVIDPTIATSEAGRWLAIGAGALVLPGSALACLLAFRRRRRLVEEARLSLHDQVR